MIEAASNVPDVSGPNRNVKKDYVRQGWRNGVVPNRWFSPDWYLAHYPDVAESGVEPLLHYVRCGWRERRDPGPAFKTDWYLAQYPDVLSDGLNPLKHYLSYGRSEGRHPHPLLGPIDLRAPKVGVVIVSFNAPDVLALTLESLRRRRGPVPFEIFLVENGSSAATKERVRKLAGAAREQGLALHLDDEPQNRGYSGGNNIGIARALDAGCTHVCLLNSDVVVTPGWLEMLLNTGEPVVGPVSNAVGNEQTVPVDYTINRSSDPFEAVDDFAQRWRSAFRRQVVYSDFLGFFCVLIRRDVIERVGVLDEQFFPGSYEDDDYCLRLLERGYQLAIARHVFVHHWGSASFEALPFEQRLRIGDENRSRFEVKHGRAWVDRSHLLLRSWSQDQARTDPSDGNESLSRATLAAHLNVNETLVRRLTDAVRHLQHERASLQAANAELELRIEGFADWKPFGAAPSARVLAFGEHAVDLDALSRRERSRYEQLLGDYWRSLARHSPLRFADLTGAQPLLAEFARATAEPLILILAAGDPITGPKGDGYVQRVVAIDHVMASASRLYLRFQDDKRGRPVLSALADGVWRLDLADGDPIGDALLDALCAQKAQLYCHSVLRLEPTSARRLLKQRHGVAVLDIHGVLPEEFRMYEDHFSAQVFGGYEREAFRTFDAFVCVTREMARHYKHKYGQDERKIIHCPIFPEAPDVIDTARRYNHRPCIVYAGGTQRWQKIPELLDIVAETCLEFDYQLLSPGAEELELGLVQRGIEPAVHGVTIRSLEPTDVWDIYRRADFGVLLRDDSPVNRVACPTKLVEYIGAGVIPILDTPHVGDFVAEGLRFVPVAELRAGRLPDVAERRAIATHNRSLFSSMVTSAERGKSEIAGVLQLAPAPAAERQASSDA